MDRQNKVWGERWLLRKDSTHAVSFLKLHPDCRCSWHCHTTKFNLFVILWGKVKITTEELGGVVRDVVLTEGQCFTTRPGQFHSFYSVEASGMLEEMYVEYDEGDIDRVRLGEALNV